MGPLRRPTSRQPSSTKSVRQQAQSRLDPQSGGKPPGRPPSHYDFDSKAVKFLKKLDSRAKRPSGVALKDSLFNAAGKGPVKGKPKPILQPGHWRPDWSYKFKEKDLDHDRKYSVPEIVGSDYRRGLWKTPKVPTVERTVRRLRRRPDLSVCLIGTTFIPNYEDKYLLRYCRLYYGGDVPLALIVWKPHIGEAINFIKRYDPLRVIRGFTDISIDIARHEKMLRDAA